MDLRKLDHQQLRDVIGTCNYGKPGLAEGTNANTIKTVAATVYSIGGQQYSKAATDNVAMAALAAQAVSTTAYYLASVNAAGTVKLTKGTDNVIDVLPEVPSGYCQIGAIKIDTDATHTFTSGTTDLSATGITASFYDLSRTGTGVPS